MYTLGSYFSGVGALDLGLERAGFQVAWQVENDPFCQRVLAKHWPDTPRYDDATTLDPARLRPVDAVAGGFPCQPVSQAGKRLAQADERWLWPHMADAVRVLRPRLVIVENVRGLVRRGLSIVVGDLAALGYDCVWGGLPASALGATHKRYRVFVVAFPVGQRLQGCFPAGTAPQSAPRAGAVADAEGERRGQGGPAQGGSSGRPASGGQDVADPAGPGRAGPLAAGATLGRPVPARRLEPGRPGGGGAGDGHPEPGVGGAADGAAAWLDRHRWPAPPGEAQHGWEAPRTVRGRNAVSNRTHRVRALGNAVVPAWAEWVGRLALELDAP